MYFLYMCSPKDKLGHAVAQLVEALHYKGSIPDGVTGIFH